MQLREETYNTLINSRSIRLPIYSLAAGFLLAGVLLVHALTGRALSATATGALAFLPLAAALVDSIRLRRRADQNGAEQGTAGQLDERLAGRLAGQLAGQLDDSSLNKELRDWLARRDEELTLRQQQVATQAMAVKQWLQFPDAIDFRDDVFRDDSTTSDSSQPADDPLAKHDRELIALVDTKTKQLFENVSNDAYRLDGPEGKVFDTARVRHEVIDLVSKVAKIYRPNDPSPLLRTNVEAISRAVGRASLRLLVTVEELPIDMSSYDFQSIYDLVIRAVKTFGYYKSAKPYLDVASGMLLAGRVVSSTNPITLVAWWAASKATTYGASQLGQHVINQQAVGLIRKVVEIVALEVASIYSPMIRYRDPHWIFGVELVYLANRLSISQTARLRVIQQIATLSLRDEYGRVSLLRHAAGGSVLHPESYRPANSLSAADRKLVAEQLEAFLVKHVLGDRQSRVQQARIDQWQADASERLEIQFRADQIDADESLQTERAVWSLAAFALQHLDDEPDQALDRLRRTQTWSQADSTTHTDWIRRLKADPPFIYHPPSIQPESEICNRFLSDLTAIAGDRTIGTLDRDHTDMLRDDSTLTIPVWSGDEALRVTAYFLRTEVEKLIGQYQSQRREFLLGPSDHAASPEVIAAVEYLLAQLDQRAPVDCLYSDAIREGHSEKLSIVRLGDSLICFSATTSDNDLVELKTYRQALRSAVQITKKSGYVRSDCQLTFPTDFEVTLPGSTLRGYDSYFAPLVKASGTPNQ